MADPTPTPNGRNARRHASTDRRIAKAREEGRRDGRAEIATLEARLEELEADLAVATHFLVGRYRIGRRGDHWEVCPELSRIGLAAGRDYDPIPARTRDEALATARRLTAEEIDRV
ncbi:hypothetical protein [Nocardiopsis ganjiahuensis]|uniref:hypothetical protein n=1 Tax=Nocardiopsis ganjiahuensis TaxID=239984 RepID=UPI000345A858|nr:hypothetical protein [Nocardiopsis ganjiahuensis]